MLARANAGEWAGYGELLRRHEKLLTGLPAAERAAAMASAVAVFAGVLERAQADRDAVATRLDGIGKTRRVENFYTLNGGARLRR